METTEKSKPVPCAYCRVVPTTTETHFAPIIWETNPDCPSCRGRRPFVPDWNDVQEKLLELRRKDFETGVRKGILGFSDMAQDTFLGAFDDLTCGELRDKIFKDYIAEGKGDE